jgi:hypothetical protein
MRKNLVCCTIIFLGLVSRSLAADIDTARIDQITGLKGKMNEKEGVYKVTFPRNDGKWSSMDGRCRRLWVSERGRHSRQQKMER